jgi:murein DD-endopeptidase MepM/ murein hydrolase activator NlpD
MEKSRRAVVNDLDWAASGTKMAKKMIQGAFGMSLTDFRRWMVTGEYPKPKKKQKPRQQQAYETHPEKYKNNHSGGWAGTYDNRRGVARTSATHPNETMIRAQKGQFIVNKEQSAKHAPLLEAINSGKVVAGRTARNNGARGTDAPLGKNQGGFTDGFGGAMALGFSGLMLAAASQAIVGGMRTAIQTGAAKAMAETGDFSTTKAGKFGGTALDAAQIKNAVTIANTASQLGASARDIKIALITAMTESGLRNLDYGDRDSVGLFQQRDAWGSFADRTNPVAATKMFFQGGAAGQRGLFDFPDRGDMSMGEAAQAVQVSAFPGRYATWLPMVNELFSAIHGGSGAGYVPGMGGKHRPIPQPVSRGIHDSETGFPAVDMAAPSGTPVHAVADGTITRSEDLRGFEPRNSVQNGYYSYGRVIQQSTPLGEVLYAHLSRRSVHKGMKVKGGAVIGAVGTTGHSTGDHLHFGARGTTPYAFLRDGGIVKQDGTLSVLHKDEGVLTAPLTRTLQDGIGGISDAGQVLSEIRRAGLSQGAYDNTRVGQVSDYHYGMNKNTPSAGGGTGKKGQVRIASFNVHAYGHNNAKSIADLAKILPRTDAIALQENTRKAVTAWIQKQGFGVRQGPTGTAIAWRKSKFAASQFGNWDLNKKYKMPRGTSQRYIPYGLMTDKQTKKKFWLGSAHLIPGTGYFKGRVSDAQRNAILNEQYQRMAMLRNKLDNTAPVVFGGDYNDARKGRIKGLNASGHKGIDKIYSGLKGTGKATKLSNKITNSDHAAVFQSYRLPGLRTGGFTLSDGLAKLHKNETVLTAPLSEKLNIGIDKLADGAGNVYNLHMYGFDGRVSEDVLADKVISRIRRIEGRRAGTRSTR